VIFTPLRVRFYILRKRRYFLRSAVTVYDGGVVDGSARLNMERLVWNAVGDGGVDNHRRSGQKAASLLASLKAASRWR